MERPPATEAALTLRRRPALTRWQTALALGSLLTFSGIVLLIGEDAGASGRTRTHVVVLVDRDTDRDGLTDTVEVRRYHTDPRRRDTDRDGLTDGDEVRRFHTNPRARDTDGDGHSDSAEIRTGTNPRDGRSRPGFPAADTTGVPAGTRLTEYTGPSTISKPNTVIERKTMGCIRVMAPGVVIRDSKISCGTSNYAILSGDGDYAGNPLRLEDTEIDCRHTNATAVGEANVRARRLDIHGCENGLDVNRNITLEDSYIHDLYNTAESHTDGIQFATGHFVDGQVVPGVLDVTIRHNTIYGMGDGDFGTSAIISGHGGDANVLIADNLLAGGAFTIYCEQDARGINYRIQGNHFTRKFGPKVGYYGPSTDCSDEIQSGNVYHESGAPLRLE